MEKKIAIITGASGGIGKEFTRLMLREDVSEVWAIARNQEKLTKLKAEFGDKIIAISKDLSKSDELLSIGELLKKQKPVIAYLINNAGLARMGAYKDFTAEEIMDTTNINCIAPAVLCTLCIPYMTRGSRILNISSAASFQPLPYLNLYSATKVFERYYSRALNLELKGTGITSTAVCPSWVDTELLIKEVNGKSIDFPGIVTPEEVAAKALKDARRGKDMSVCTLYVKYEHFLSKLFPQKIIMNTWLRKIKKYM
ncbi:NADP-dependent 3-hydroxy acid dehydrogenase YdfG [Ruminiclostridium hungatei]|uniref:NADP-dependent 3-hydroxy acid dehydrogenase YdfG n=1 Tax=Ruminiclostridium hungatei TaxID=48256 RepID=A0A1V4SMS0_RUMHU|nr:SDR family NAD(P)-dependent oxidoreductase [Ruminiclostridium hungatei]OPX45124.1 NADP-dependent 3-hydroxy acid dehydrogenase YdfG [Ruminiclostridium hungatei]